MIGRAKHAAKVLLDRIPAQRGVEVFPSDVFIVSYPRSGNTWTRFLIGNLAYPQDPLTFANVEDKVPDIYQNKDSKLKRLPKPRILKSHEYFDPRYEKVIYIVRDPRDVAVSYYHYHVKVRMIDEGCPMEEYVSRFVSGSLDPFGTWGENVGSWLGTRRDHDKFLLLQYEQMLQEPVRELRRIASFLSIDATQSRLDNAIEASSADVMREMEREQSGMWATTKRSRTDKAFVRSSKAGGWRSELPEASVAAIEEAWGDLMEDLGYL